MPYSVAWGGGGWGMEHPCTFSACNYHDNQQMSNMLNFSTKSAK